MRIAIVGGGPSALFMFKRFVDAADKRFDIEIFEKQQHVGIGMPYGPKGASDEHITNVSGNEIPDLPNELTKWIKNLPQTIVEKYGIDADSFNAYKVLPRLLFGQYLATQFDLLKQQAAKETINTTLHYGTTVTDIKDYPEKNIVDVEFDNRTLEFDFVVICIGHTWPLKYEPSVPGYFDSPYPPEKIKISVNFPVAIRGASLTAIDAVRTLARQNGTFSKDNQGMIHFAKAESSNSFKVMMHSRNGLLPAIRFHLEDSHLSKDSVLSKKEVEEIKTLNEGFLPLDYVFDKNFKDPLKENDPDFYAIIKDMMMEDFVSAVMNIREKIPPFELFKAEYEEAEKSIRRRESVYWKEMLAVLSFTMNYPAKYFSAEDMLRLQKVLMPLISVVIAFVPQTSVEEMLALHRAGVLDLLAVGEESDVTPEPTGGATYSFTDESNQKISNHYKLFIDCIGQPHLSFDELPFKSMVTSKTVSAAKLKFRNAAKGGEEMKKENSRVIKDSAGNYFLRVPGITINDYFQVVDETGNANYRIFMMAVPYIGGFNPDYSGLDFCEAASAKVYEKLKKSYSC